MPGPQELLVIALVALFVLGPERLPQVARGASRLLTRVRNYGVTASKELRGVADLGDIEQEVSDLRRELDRTRADLRRAMRETVTAADPEPLRRPDVATPPDATAPAPATAPAAETASAPATEPTSESTPAPTPEDATTPAAESAADGDGPGERG